MTSPGSRFQPAVEEYVSAIETHLRARRGVEHILSPRDFLSVLDRTSSS